MKNKKQTIKAYALVWHDHESHKIDYADAHVCNECPSVEETKALAIYESIKDSPYGHKGKEGEYELVTCTITY